MMPTALPALDRPIAADHSSSIVVDIPFGDPRRGAAARRGRRLQSRMPQVLATADGHPRAIAYLSRTPPQTLPADHRAPVLR